MTCDPGLGKAVDTQPPTVSVSFPATKTVLKGGFIMKGIATDEVKVASCVVTFKNIKTSQEYTFPASVNNGEFIVNVNSPKADGSFELADGDYNVTVTVSDAYRNSTADVVYTIDNTAPTVLLTNPNIYVANNWPSMYKLFTIKGEVYDYTTITEVKVFVVDGEGNILVEKVAEGTNTFLASFENPPIPTGSTCYYYAVAKDSGGNENTYCYHKQDIYALISQHQKNSTFPSINSIGYVDQNVEEKFNESINNQLLSTKKIDNKNIISEKGSRPGFDFFDKDTAQVKWMNLSEDSLAGISIGTPVIGTIMPPTDGSAVLNVDVWLAKSSDGGMTFSEYTEENKIETGWVTYDAEGNVVNEKQGKLNSVGESVNFQIDSHKVGSDDNWPSGVYKIKIKYVTNSEIEGFSECAFQVTSGAPKLTEGNFSPNQKLSYYRGFMTVKTLSEGKNYLKGISKTSDEESTVPLVYEVSGSRTDIGNAIMSNDGSYSIEIPIDAENHLQDGEYTYTLTAKVSDVLSTVISRVIVVDTTNPVVNFTNLTDKQVVSSKEFVVRGNAEDRNGISKIEYQLYANGTQILLDGTPSQSGWISVSGMSTSFELPLTNLKKNISYKLKIKATDPAGNITGEEDNNREFTIDNTNPEIKINSVSPQIEYAGKDTVNGKITVNLTVTDINTVEEFYYTFDNAVEDDSDWLSQENKSKVTSFDLTTGVKTIEIDTTKFSNGSELPLRIKAVDEAGNTSVVKVNPIVDQESDKPSISPSNFEKLGSIEDAGWKGTNTVNVFGSSNPNLIFTVLDDDLVKEYYAKVNDGEYKSVGVVSSAQKIVTYSVKDLPYGRHKITLKVVDDKYVNDSTTPNNVVEEVFYVAIDDGQPKLTLNNASGQFVGNEFTISGEATDANEIDFVTLQSESGNVYSTMGLGSGLVNGKFSYTFRLEDLPTKEAIIITASDKIGNSSSTKFTYSIDSTLPSVEIKKYSGAIDGYSPQTRIEGTAKDGTPTSADEDISKIDLVRLRIGTPVEGIDDEDSVLATGKVDDNGTMTWSAVLDFNDFVEENESKTFIVYAAAFDFAGNMSEQKSIQVSVDGDVPVFDHEYKNTNNNVGEKTDSFDVFFNVTDSSGIENILVSVQGYDKKITLENLSNGDYKFTVPNDVGDGHLSIVITATDKCKKTSTLTLTATLDSKSPVLEFTNIEANGSTKQTNSSPVVNISYSDETSGVTEIEYKFLYKSSKDSTYEDFTEYEDKNSEGTITLDNVISGSLKIFMAGTTSSSGKGPFVNQTSDTDGEWKVWYQITDAAGHNTTGYSPVFIVDRHAPNLNVLKPIANELKKENDSLTVEGTVIDDFGGTIDKVVVQVNHNKYDNNDRATFTKTFTKNDGLVFNSNTCLYDWSITWNESNSPFKYSDDYEVVVTAYDTAENQYEIKNKVSCDNSAPEINFIKPYLYTVDTLGNIDSQNSVNSPMGTTTVTASIKEFKMKNIFYQIGGTVILNNGSVTNAGTKNYKITNISVTNGGIQDKTEENVFENPSSEQGISAGILSGIWKKLGDANNGFTADVDTLKYVTEGKTVELLDNDPSNDKNIIQTLEIHLVALDDAGNINYCAMPILVDTDTDKPELLVLSPKIISNEANVGGTTTISGTVNDDNNVHSVWMNVVLEGGNYVNNILTQKDGFKTFGIDYSQGDYGITSPQSITIDEEDKTFSSPVSDSAYFKDSTKWYKVNLTEQAKSTTWNLMLNKDSEFDITKEEFRKYFTSDTSTLEETTLKIRVIALDKKDNDDSLSKSKLSEISTFTLKIDSGSPSIVINNIQDVPVEGSYIGGNIDFDLTFTDDGSITYWSVVAKGSNGESTIASGTPNQKTVKTTVTMDTVKVNEDCGNVITLKIYAEDNSKDASGSVENNKTSEETFKYTIDNTAPVGSVVETVEGKSYMITTESVVGDSTGAHRETDDRGNHLRIKSASALLSGKVNDEINGSGVDYVMLYFTKKIGGTNYIFNPGNGKRTGISSTLSVKSTSGTDDAILFPVASFADVKRNNNSLSTTNYIIIDKAEGLLDNGSNGDGDGYDENLKSNGEWMVTIDSSKLPDGVYEIFYVVVDIAGNARYYKDSMLVQNSAPFISSVVLSTDIDGDEACEVTFDGHGDEDKLYDSSIFDKDTGIANTDFVVRNNVLKIRVNVTGGKDPLKYYMIYKDSSGTEKKITGTLDNDHRSGIFEIKGDVFQSDGDSNYVIWVEDSVENDIFLSSERQTIKLTLDNIDDVAPVAQFIELNTDTSDSNNRGSLFKDNSKIQGHIEPRANSKFVEGTPDISGKIILRGEAYDNQRISSIKLELPTGEVDIAKWSDASKSLVGSSNAELVKNELGLSGHYVEWSYVWDTNSFVGSNVNVSVVVNDSKPNTSASTSYASDNTVRTGDNKFNSNGWGYNSMTVDIVPYITNITRYSKYPSTRARSGAIPLLRDEGTNRIEGFNLGTKSDKDGGNLKVEITSDRKGTTSVTTDSIEIGKDDDNTNVITFYVPNDAKDGYLSTVVKGVRSINNINDNTQSYNKEGNEYQSNTKYWTDDRFVRIWQDTDRFGNTQTSTVNNTSIELAKNPAYPAMSMDASGKLYASFTNYSMHNVYYTAINAKSTAVFKGFDSPEETTILVTGSGSNVKVNVAYMGNYQSGGDYANWNVDRGAAGGLHLYDPYLKNSGKATAWKNHYMTRFELLYHNMQFQQFKNFRLARRDTNDNGNIHVAYYDIDTMSIHYSVINSDMDNYGQSNWESCWVNIDGDSDSDDTGKPGSGSSSYTRDTDGNNITLSNACFSDSGLTRTTATGEYVGIDLTLTNHYPVLVYFDSLNQVVKLARANTKVAKYDESCWKVQRVITNSADDNYTTTNGNYVDMQIDNNGYVHVVFVNGKGELIYVKSTNNPNDGETEYEFGPSVVIAENSPMNVDITVRGETPYIGYLSSLGSFDGLNTAFFDKDLDLDNNGSPEGGWETMSAPLTNAVSNNRACVEAHPTPSSSSWESAHAYYSTGYYRVAYYIGNGSGH
ncbi:MAG: hypothetical protein UH788_10855 [Treponemataceae bacterium]|nr:hypothetical protein [Treponemataceae bacterium]